MHNFFFLLCVILLLLFFSQKKFFFRDIHVLFKRILGGNLRYVFHSSTFLHLLFLLCKENALVIIVSNVEESWKMESRRVFFPPFFSPIPMQKSTVNEENNSRSSYVHGRAFFSRTLTENHSKAFFLFFFCLSPSFTSNAHKGQQQWINLWSYQVKRFFTWTISTDNMLISMDSLPAKEKDNSMVEIPLKRIEMCQSINYLVFWGPQFAALLEQFESCIHHSDLCIN